MATQSFSFDFFFSLSLSHFKSQSMNALNLETATDFHSQKRTKIFSFKKKK